MNPLPLILIAAFVISAPARAQDNDDWDIGRDPVKKLTIAAATFDSGVGLATRCMDGAFDVLFSGLPSASGPIRTLEFGFGDAPLVESSWSVGDDKISAFSDLPAPLARRLRAGGRVQVVVPADAGQPARRFVLDLPRSDQAINETLTACRRPLSDTRDARLSPSIPPVEPTGGARWTRLPQARFPDRAQQSNISVGAVTTSCLVQADGHLTDCVIETERPAGFGFGRAALDAARTARLAPAPNATGSDGGVVAYRTRFALQ